MAHTIEQQEMLPHFYFQDGFVQAVMRMTTECAKRANDYLNEIGAYGQYVTNVNQEIRTKPKRRRVDRPKR